MGHCAPHAVNRIAKRYVLNIKCKINKSSEYIKTMFFINLVLFPIKRTAERQLGEGGGRVRLAAAAPSGRRTLHALLGDDELRSLAFPAGPYWNQHETPPRRNLIDNRRRRSSSRFLETGSRSRVLATATARGERGCIRIRP